MDDEAVRQLLSGYEAPQVTDQGIVYDSKHNADKALVMRAIPEKKDIEQRAGGLLQWVQNEDFGQRQVIHFTNSEEQNAVKRLLLEESREVKVTDDGKTLVINSDKEGEWGSIVWGDPPADMQQIIESAEMVMWFAPSRWFPDMAKQHDRDSDKQVAQVLQALQSDMPPEMLKNYITESLDTLDPATSDGLTLEPTANPSSSKIKARRAQNRATVARRGRNRHVPSGPPPKLQ